MTISEIVGSELIECDGVKDNIPVYSPYIRKFTYGQELVDCAGGEAVYKRSDKDLFVEDFNKDTTYGLNDIAVKDDKLQYVYSMLGTKLKQPDEYSNFDTSLFEDDWSHRFLKLYKTNNGVIGNFSIRKDNNLFVGYTDENTKGSIRYYTGFMKSVNIHLGYYDENDDSSNCFIANPALNIAGTWAINGEIYPWHEVNEGDIIWFASDGTVTFYDSDGNKVEVTSNIGFLIEVGNNVLHHNDNTGTDYRDFKIIGIMDTNHDYVRSYLKNQDVTGYEPIPTYTKNDHLYIPRWYKDGYIRTSIECTPQYYTINEPQWKVLEKISEIQWGWTYYKPSSKYAPFDDKKYTFLEVENDVIYTIKSKGKFDMLAFNGLVASRIKVEIYNENNDIVEEKEVTPKCFSTLAGKTKIVQGVSFLYLDREYKEETKLKIYIQTLNGKVRIGGGYLGNKNIAGFTNLEFRNSFINYNYYKKDEWGNVVSINNDSAKIRVFEGTADIDLKEYDDLTPILQHFMDAKAIIDGSDNWGNVTPDSENFFVGSSIIGRVRTFTQSTKTINGRMDYTATYTFKIEEDV